MQHSHSMDMSRDAAARGPSHVRDRELTLRLVTPTKARRIQVCVLIFFKPWLYLPLARGERVQDPSGRA